ncbi:MAG TPA: MBL fold metallo-hydrolase, partial [Thermoleophilaceae bacterium]|nr:MBL fold metallo-hydrolase [Thermoleophilaceae bacterium]
METVAEPRPAELPIVGGRAGAMVVVHPLLTGRMLGPEGWFLRAEGRFTARRAFGIGVPKRTWREVPVPAFLVEHPGAGAILIDTGFHPSVAVNPRQNLGRLAQLAYRDLEMDPAQSVPAQLREKGIPPGDVRVVIMTHLHSDHASAISEFPQATFV